MVGRGKGTEESRGGRGGNGEHGRNGKWSFGEVEVTAAAGSNSCTPVKG
jgi:hypothetical protein